MIEFPATCTLPGQRYSFLRRLYTKSVALFNIEGAEFRATVLPYKAILAEYEAGLVILASPEPPSDIVMPTEEEVALARAEISRARISLEKVRKDIVHDYIGKDIHLALVDATKNAIADKEWTPDGSEANGIDYPLGLNMNDEGSRWVFLQRLENTLRNSGEKDPYANHPKLLDDIIAVQTMAEANTDWETEADIEITKVGY